MKDHRKSKVDREFAPDLWTQRMPAGAAPDQAGRNGPLLGRIIPTLAPPSGASSGDTPVFRVPMPCLGGPDHLQQGWWGGEVQETASAQTDSGLRLHYARSADVLWACVEVHNTQDLLSQGQAAYELLLQTVRTQGRPHLLRLWNYLPRINAIEQGEERYQSFNRGRRRAFRAAGYTVADGAPAACALGLQAGAFQVAALAGRRPATAIENPRQVSAYHYPRQYGEEPPIFSRAAWLPQAGGRDLLFVSGTASIVGHETLHAGDVLAQTRESVRNIEAVLQVANERAGAPLWRLADLSGCVYVRHARDYPLIRDCLESLGLRRYGYLQADICRSDLLLEIEAEGQLGGGCIANCI